MGASDYSGNIPNDVGMVSVGICHGSILLKSVPSPYFREATGTVKYANNVKYHDRYKLSVA